MSYTQGQKCHCRKGLLLKPSLLSDPSRSGTQYEHDRWFFVAINYIDLQYSVGCGKTKVRVTSLCTAKLI